MTRPRSRAATAAIVLLVSAPALAQTPLPSQSQTPARAIGQSAPANPVPTTPPGKTPQPPAPTPAPQTHVQAQPLAPAQSQPASQPQAAVSAKVPMSGASYTQAMEQSEGLFTAMQRPGAGGQIQEAWDKVDVDSTSGQQRQGVYVTRLCEDCVYKVRSRELMTTTLHLPEDAVIAGEPDLGDPAGFRVKVKAANIIAVRPNSYGVDTNLTVYTKSGRVYPFYIRAESYNSVHVPDLVVKIIGREKAERIEVPEPVGAAAPTRQEKDKLQPKRGDKTAAAIRDLTSPAPAAGDFVRNVPFDPSKLHGWKDYTLKGDSDLRPEVVYRDDFFTYIRYGEKWDGMELSTAYVTIDGVDELVNTRVQGSTYIVESVAPLITLKNGKKYLCIRYTGEKP